MYVNTGDRMSDDVFGSSLVGKARSSLTSSSFSLDFSRHVPKTSSIMEGKVYAITGSASGIGLATARHLLSRGAIVSIADVRQEALDTAVADLAGQYESKNIFARVLDVTKFPEVATWIDGTIQRFGRLDGAANLAGIEGKSITLKGIVDLDEEEWDQVISVNLKGVFHCLKAELRRMESNASIVNAASVAGLMGSKNCAAYSSSKASHKIT